MRDAQGRGSSNNLVKRLKIHSLGAARDLSVKAAVAAAPQAAHREGRPSRIPLARGNKYTNIKGGMNEWEWASERSSKEFRDHSKSNFEGGRAKKKTHLACQRQRGPVGCQFSRSLALRSMSFWGIIGISEAIG